MIPKNIQHTVPGDPIPHPFGMVSSRDPWKTGCWWPPTFGDEKGTLNHLVIRFPPAMTNNPGYPLGQPHHPVVSVVLFQLPNASSQHLPGEFSFSSEWSDFFVRSRSSHVWCIWSGQTYTNILQTYPLIDIAIKPIQFLCNSTNNTPRHLLPLKQTTRRQNSLNYVSTVNSDVFPHSHRVMQVCGTFFICKIFNWILIMSRLFRMKKAWCHPVVWKTRCCLNVLFW